MGDPHHLERGAFPPARRARAGRLLADLAMTVPSTLLWLFYGDLPEGYHEVPVDLHFVLLPGILVLLVVMVLALPLAHLSVRCFERIAQLELRQRAGRIALATLGSVAGGVAYVGTVVLVVAGTGVVIIASLASIGLVAAAL